MSSSRTIPPTPSFPEVVREHGPFIRRTLLQLGVPARDLDDVIQEVLRAVERRLPAFDASRSARPDTALRGWIFRICEHQSASYRGAARRRVEQLCSIDVFDSHPVRSADVEAQLHEHERAALLFTLLSHLDPSRRDVVIAHELDEVPMVHVARSLGIPLNTAWNRLRLGRADLHAAWRRLRHTSPRPLAPATHTG